MRREQSVGQLPSQALETKLDGEDVDSEDNCAHKLVVGLFVKRARGEEAAEERQAERLRQNRKRTRNLEIILSGWQKNLSLKQGESDFEKSEPF